MKTRDLILSAIFANFLLTATAAEAQSTPGTIRGRVLLSGKNPGNPIIRMGRDPKCNQLNTGKRVIQETVITGTGGGLANVFVKLEGRFPAAAVPIAPVTIDQRNCIYMPRVVGVRVGQTLEIRNSDELLHNVHAFSTATNNFNVGQPRAGVVYRFKAKDEETMLRLKCDIHSWMTAYVGVVSHPYFSVTGNSGTFEITGVPPGTYTISTWHERFGVLTKSVRVAPGAATSVDFAYTGSETAGKGL
jgi:hypothetical protein